MKREPVRDFYEIQRLQRGGVFLGYLALSASSIIMHLLSTLISRQREILADAAPAHEGSANIL